MICLQTDKHNQIKSEDGKLSELVSITFTTSSTKLVFFNQFFFNIDKLKSWLGNNVSDVQYQASMNLISILNSIP